MMATELAVIGTGLACAAGTTAAELLHALGSARATGTSVTRPAVADGTPTPAVLAQARSTIDDLGQLKWRRYMGTEAELFVAAGTAAAQHVALDLTRRPNSVGIVCSTVSAGLAEYAQMYRSARAGTERAANLVRGPQSSFNSPASHLSLHLGAQGGCMTLIGDKTSGLAAIKQAGSMLCAGRVDTMLSGGVEGLPMAGATDDRLRGEAAAVLALTRGSSATRALARLTLITDRLTTSRPHWLPSAVADASTIDEIGLIVVVDPDIGELVLVELEHARRHIPMLVTEYATGVIGSAGGVTAIIVATEWLTTQCGTTALCISGDAKGYLTTIVVRAPARAGPS